MKPALIKQSILLKPEASEEKIAKPHKHKENKNKNRCINKSVSFPPSFFSEYQVTASSWSPSRVPPTAQAGEGKWEAGSCCPLTSQFRFLKGPEQESSTMCPVTTCHLLGLLTHVTDTSSHFIITITL